MPSNTASPPAPAVLVGDIGGTYARLGIATFPDGVPVIRHESTFTCRAFDSLADCLKQYSTTLPLDVPTQACLAVAGPVTDDRFTFTNHHWAFSRRHLAGELGLERLEVINDFAAQACAIPILDSSEYRTIRTGYARPDGTIALIGPGTGLGVATLVRCRDQWIPVSGEGGHARLAPHNDLMVEVLALLNREQPYVSLETLLCGSGLLRLYTALARLRGKTPRYDCEKVIVQQGADNSDPLCRETLLEFCALLGSVAGDLALTSGARGGLYLTGGILPRIPDLLEQSDFRRYFTDKGVMSHYMEDIPVHLMTGHAPALLGAAAWLNR